MHDTVWYGDAEGELGGGELSTERGNQPIPVIQNYWYSDIQSVIDPLDWQIFYFTYICWHFIIKVLPEIFYCVELMSCIDI